MKGIVTPKWLIIGFLALGTAFWALFVVSGILYPNTAEKEPPGSYFVESE